MNIFQVKLVCKRRFHATLSVSHKEIENQAELRRSIGICKLLDPFCTNKI